MACAWSSVSLNSKASSNSRTNSLPAGKEWPLRHFAFGVELEQFVGHVLHGLAHAGFGLGPRLRAEMTEGWLGPFRRPVFLNQIESRERDVEARALGVFEQHELGVAVALIDFFQTLILADAVLDVDDVVSDLQVAEVGEECGDFRLLALRARGDGVGFVEQIARAEDGEVRVGEHHAVGDVGFGERGGEHFSGEVAGFVGIAFAAAGAAAQTERDVVLGEDVGQALDFAGVGHGKQHLVALPGELLDFFEHRRNRAVEAGSGLREECCSRVCIVFTVRDAEVFDIGSGERRDFLPPIVWRQIQIHGADEIADAAALVGFFDAGPEAVELGAQQVGFVEQHGGVRKQIEDGAVGAGDGSVKLPAGKDGHAARAHGGFDDFFRAGDAFAREPRVNRAEQLIADRRFGERQQQRFVDGIRGTLRSGIEAADRIDFVAEEFDADGALGFGRIDIEDAAAERVLAGHFDDVGGLVADGVQVREQLFDIEGFAAAQNAGEVGVVLGGAQQNGRGGDRSDHDRSLAGGNLPQGGRALFL